ncbi:MAG TPA: SDR family NAD(P)-dependent oxidoreductase [Nitrospira sp.]
MKNRRSLSSAPYPAHPAIQRAVLITGASGGIGRAISVEFANAGWHIGIHYHHGKDAAEKTLKQVCEAGGSGSLYQADLREIQAVHRMVEAFSRHVPVVSVLICNAGIGGGGLVLRYNDDDWSNVIATNLTGTFHCMKAMGLLLAQRGGSIVVIGSHAAFHGSVGQAAYAASKAGLVGLVKTAAQEWGPLNIRVNLLLPGWHKTRVSQEAIPKADQYTDHALRRSPSITGVAETVLHLAESTDISGQIWNCDSRNL